MRSQSTIQARTLDPGLRAGHFSGWPAKNCRSLIVKIIGPETLWRLDERRLEFGHVAPRSGAGKLARGTRFLRTPGILRHSGIRTLKGCRGLLAPRPGVRFLVRLNTRGTQKTRTPG